MSPASVSASVYNGFFKSGLRATADMSDDLRIGFIGAGKMATALAQGWLKAGLVHPERLRAGDPIAAARDAFANATGGAGLADNHEVVAESDAVVLAVKPQ